MHIFSQLNTNRIFFDMTIYKGNIAESAIEISISTCVISGKAPIGPGGRGDQQNIVIKSGCT